MLSNVTGKEAVNGSEIKKNAVLHLTNPVLWTAEESVLGGMIGQDVEQWLILEPGPGKVLSGLWRDTEFGEKIASVPVNTAETVANIE